MRPNAAPPAVVSFVCWRSATVMDDGTAEVRTTAVRLNPTVQAGR